MLKLSSPILARAGAACLFLFSCSLAPAQSMHWNIIYESGREIKDAVILGVRDDSVDCQTTRGRTALAVDSIRALEPAGDHRSLGGSVGEGVAIGIVAGLTAEIVLYNNSFHEVEMPAFLGGVFGGGIVGALLYHANSQTSHEISGFSRDQKRELLSSLAANSAEVQTPVTAVPLDSLSEMAPPVSLRTHDRPPMEVHASAGLSVPLGAFAYTDYFFGLSVSKPAKPGIVIDADLLVPVDETFNGMFSLAASFNQFHLDFPYPDGSSRDWKTIWPLAGVQWASARGHFLRLHTQFQMGVIFNIVPASVPDAYGNYDFLSTSTTTGVSLAFRTGMGCEFADRITLDILLMHTEPQDESILNGSHPPYILNGSVSINFAVLSLGARVF